MIFLTDYENEYNGYFSYLRNNSYNIHETVEVIAESKESKDKWLLIDPLNDKQGWQSLDGQNQFTINLLKHKLFLAKYTIVNFGSTVGMASSYPTDWLLLGSNDNSNYEQIDKQTNIKFCNGIVCTYSRGITFSIEKPNSYKYIQFIMTRESNNWPCLTLSGIELFGIIFNSFFSLTQSNMISYHILYILVVILT